MIGPVQTQIWLANKSQLIPNSSRLFQIESAFHLFTTKVHENSKLARTLSNSSAAVPTNNNNKCSDHLTFIPSVPDGAGLIYSFVLLPYARLNNVYLQDKSLYGDKKNPADHFSYRSMCLETLYLTYELPGIFLETYEVNKAKTKMKCCCKGLNLFLVWSKA